MSNSIIKVENLSKQYRLGMVGTGTLRHDLHRSWAKFRGKENPYKKVGAINNRTVELEEDYVWAVKDLNFEVAEGEVLGIIGNNGAGKSTLLKLLSRITSPTTGSIELRGRVGSLLEVGTGFHPELTGRDNIFLNGAILGMKKWEIKKKLDEIVEFSGIGKYIDTPVKRYSSGMNVRLGFAVAAHLEPEILIVDEVLAVGDAEFQQKCLGKMKDVAKSGRTIIFVSHNLASVRQLCSRAIVIDSSVKVFDGKADGAVGYYLSEIAFPQSIVQKSFGTGEVKYQDISFNRIDATYCTGESVIITLGVEAFENISNVDVGVSFHNSLGETVTITYLSNSRPLLDLNPGIKSLNLNIPKLALAAGIYYLKVRLASPSGSIDWPQHYIGKLNVVDGDYYRTGNIVNTSDSSFLMDLSWE